MKSILNDLNECCNLECYKKINPIEILRMRIKIFSKEEKMRLTYFKKIYSNSECFEFNNTIICSVLFHKIYGISNNMRSLLKNNNEYDNYYLGEESDILVENISKSEIFKMWMDDFKRNYCDPSPSSLRWFIPFMFDWNMVYNLYLNDINDKISFGKPLSKPSFYNQRKKEFPNLKS